MKHGGIIIFLESCIISFFLFFFIQLGEQFYSEPHTHRWFRCCVYIRDLKTKPRQKKLTSSIILYELCINVSQWKGMLSENSFLRAVRTATSRESFLCALAAAHQGSVMCHWKGHDVSSKPRSVMLITDGQRQAVGWFVWMSLISVSCHSSCSNDPCRMKWPSHWTYQLNPRPLMANHPHHPPLPTCQLWE